MSVFTDYVHVIPTTTSSTGPNSSHSKGEKSSITAIVASIVGVLCLIVICALLLLWKKRRFRRRFLGKKWHTKKFPPVYDDNSYIDSDLQQSASNGASIKSNHILQPPSTDSVKSEGSISNETSIKTNHSLESLSTGSVKLDGPVSNGVSIKSNHMLQSPLTDSVKSEGPIANGTSIRGNNQMSQIPLASSVRSEGPKANGETGGISHKGSKTSAGQKEPTNAVSKVSNLEESEEFEAGHYMELVPYTPDPYTPRSPMEENEYLKVVQTANTVKRRPPPSVPVNTTGSLPNSKVGQTPAFGAGYHHYKILEAGGEDPSNSPQSAKGKDISARFNDTKSHYATPEENNDKEVYTSLNANASKESCSLNSSPQPNVDNCISARFNNTKSHYDAPEENNGEDTYTSLNANASKECCFLNGSEQRNDAFELQI